MGALNLDQLLKWEPPKVPSIIEKGILYQNTRLILFGKKKSFKSMLAIHTGFQIALGKPWFGYHTNKRRVLIIQSEIPQFLFRERIIKYTSGNGSKPSNIYFCYEPYMKLDKGSGLDKFEVMVRQIKPEVVIIDPLYKALSGTIEESRFMNIFIDNMDRIIPKYNLTFIIIHHETKDIFGSSGVIDRGSESAHGSMYLLNWADSILRIEGNQSGRLEIEFTDMRHAEDELPPIRTQFNRRDLSWTKL